MGINLYLLEAQLPLGNASSGGMDDNGHFTGSNSTDSSFGNFGESLGLGTVNLMDWGVKAITGLFIVGVLLMIVSLIFKNGQWQKTGQGLMLYSFTALLVVRGLAITVLSFRNGMDVNEALNGAVGVLVQACIFIGVVGILLSFVFKLAYKLIEHPEYRRWSKNVLNVSVLMMAFALIGPYLFRMM